MPNQPLPDASVDIIGLCQQAAACVRVVNHLTLADDIDGLGYPADAYRALAALELLVERLPQAVRQIAGWFKRQVQDGKVDIDLGTPYAGDPERAAIDLWSCATDQAAPALARAADALDRATSTLVHAAARTHDRALR